MPTKIAQATFDSLHEKHLIPENHPVWSERPYKVFLKSNSDVIRRIDYVAQNPTKEGLPRQEYDFVKPFIVK